MGLKKRFLKEKVFKGDLKELTEVQCRTETVNIGPPKHWRHCEEKRLHRNQTRKRAGDCSSSNVSHIRRRLCAYVCVCILFGDNITGLWLSAVCTLLYTNVTRTRVVSGFKVLKSWCCVCGCKTRLSIASLVSLSLHSPPPPLSTTSLISLSLSPLPPLSLSLTRPLARVRATRVASYLRCKMSEGDAFLCDVGPDGIGAGLGGLCTAVRQHSGGASGQVRQRKGGHPAKRPVLQQE